MQNRARDVQILIAQVGCTTTANPRPLERRTATRGVRCAKKTGQNQNLWARKPRIRTGEALVVPRGGLPCQPTVQMNHRMNQTRAESRCGVRPEWIILQTKGPGNIEAKNMAPSRAQQRLRELIKAVEKRTRTDQGCAAPTSHFPGSRAAKQRIAHKAWSRDSKAIHARGAIAR